MDAICNRDAEMQVGVNTSVDVRLCPQKILDLLPHHSGGSPITRAPLWDELPEIALSG